MLCDPYEPPINAKTPTCYNPEITKFCGRNHCYIEATCGEFDECLRVVGEEVPQTKAPKAEKESLAENPDEAVARKSWLSGTDRPGKAPEEKDAKSFPIGAVGALRGEAYWVWPDGKRTPVRAGEPAIFGNRIITGSNGRVQLLLLDNTVFTFGANSDMEIDEFVYDPSDAAMNKLIAKATKGVFRAVTGKVARNDPTKMRVTMPVGTIGFRGTEVECKIELDGSVYLKTLSGEATFTNKLGEMIIVNAGQMVIFDRSGRFGGRKPIE